MSKVLTEARLQRQGFKTFKYLFIFLLALVFMASASTSYADDDFLDPEQAFEFSAAMADPLTLDVHYKIAPDYYMYQERFEVKITDSDDNLLLLRESTLFPDEPTNTPNWDKQVQISQGTTTYDPTFEKDMEVFHNQVWLRVPLESGATGPLDVSIISQGCADSGLCYPPMTETLQLIPQDNGYTASGDKVKTSVPEPDFSTVGAKSDKSISNQPKTGQNTNARAGKSLLQADVFDMGDLGMASWLHAAAWWQIILLSVVFGALLSLTPCVLPMVPILLAVIAGQSGHISRFKGFLLAAVYVFGMSIVYTLLGIAAGLMGAGLAAWLQSPWVLGSFAILLALFALAMLDVFTMQTPVGMQSSVQNIMQKMPGGQIGSVFIMGMLSALIVGPCVAAPLAGILLFISQTGDVVIGGSSLFAMAWGEGLLLLVVGAGAGALIPKTGAWMNSLKHGFGILLLATAWWMARPLFNSTLYAGGWIVIGLWFALLLWYSTAAAIREKLSVGAMFWRALGVLIFAWALAVLMGLFAGRANLLQPLSAYISGAQTIGYSQQQAAVDPEAIRARFTQVRSVDELDQQLAKTTRPVMLDFYADWCVSCLEMEKFTFSDPAIAQQMDDFLLLQADVTKMTDADKQLLARFDLFGPPGIIFFDNNGQLLSDTRVVGFKNARRFGKVLNQVLD